MISIIFWVLIGFIHRMLTGVTPTGRFALVSAYVPYALVAVWLVCWLILRSLKNETSTHAQKTRKQVNGFFGFMIFLSLGYGFGVLSLGKLEGDKQPPFNARIVDIKTQNVPFLRNHSTKLMKIMNKDGQSFWMLTKAESEHELWIGQDIILDFGGYENGFVTLIKPNLEASHKRIVKKWPTSKSSWHSVFDIYKSENRTGTLFDDMKVYVKHFGFDEYATKLAKHYWDKKNTMAALNILEIGYDHDPKNYQVLKNYGSYLAKKKEVERGIALLKEASEMQPDNYMAFHELALILYETGKKVEALPYIEEALKLNPGLHDLRKIMNDVNRSIASEQQAEAETTQVVTP